MNTNFSLLALSTWTSAHVVMSCGEICGNLPEFTLRPAQYNSDDKGVKGT